LQNPIGAPNEANMLDLQTARMLTRYNHWANKLIFDAVAALPEGEATRERRSIFKNMVHTLHNYGSPDLAGPPEGREHGFTARNTPGHLPLAELWSKQKAITLVHRPSDGLSAEARRRASPWSAATAHTR
jgi:hypothetical protein